MLSIAHNNSGNLYAKQAKFAEAEKDFSNFIALWCKDELDKQVFYKYSSINKYSLQGLLRKSLYLAQPADLNDPFDMPVDKS